MNYEQMKNEIINKLRDWVWYANDSDGHTVSCLSWEECKVIINALREQAGEPCGYFVDDGDDDWRQVCEEDTDYSQSVPLYTAPPAQPGAVSVPGPFRALTLLADELCSALDAADLDVGGCRPFKEIFADLGPATEAARELVAKSYIAAPRQPEAQLAEDEAKK